MSKGGAVTAEQLAPYLDVQMADLERVDGQVNEDFVVCPPCPALLSLHSATIISESDSCPLNLCTSCIVWCFYRGNCDAGASADPV